MNSSKKLMRQMKANKKALSYKLKRDAGGGAREQERRRLGGFFNVKKSDHEKSDQT